MKKNLLFIFISTLFVTSCQELPDPSVEDVYATKVSAIGTWKIVKTASFDEKTSKFFDERPANDCQAKSSVKITDKTISTDFYDSDQGVCSNDSGQFTMDYKPNGIKLETKFFGDDTAIKVYSKSSMVFETVTKEIDKTDKGTTTKRVRHLIYFEK